MCHGNKSDIGTIRFMESETIKLKGLIDAAGKKAKLYLELQRTKNKLYTKLYIGICTYVCVVVCVCGGACV